MLAGNGPMTALRVTSRAQWMAQDRAAGVVPHLAYALAEACALELSRR
jgi:hypothetical protein